MVSASRRRHAMLPATTTLDTAAVPARERPAGGMDTHGTASIAHGAYSLLVVQARGNAIGSRYSSREGGAARASFSDGASATPNRATGALPFSIGGRITATGSIDLADPAVGAGGMVRTGRMFVVSTREASDADFLAGGDPILGGGFTVSVRDEGVTASLGGGDVKHGVPGTPTRSPPRRNDVVRTRLGSPAFDRTVPDGGRSGAI